MPLANARDTLRIALLCLGMGALVACAGSSARTSESEDAPMTTRPAAQVLVQSHKKALSMFPCQRCHQHVKSEGGSVRRGHSSIGVDHMEGGEHCQTCHAPENPEMLRLATGESFGLDDVHELCRQCHSPQVADWDVGIHGKQVGNWLTEVQRLACTSCHDPHRPAIGSTMSLPPPPFPRLGIPKRGEH